VKIAEFEASPHWRAGPSQPGITKMAFYHVTESGREALAAELRNVERYGRRYAISGPHMSGIVHIFAHSRSAAKYQFYLECESEESFMEFTKDLRARLAP